MAEMSDAYAYQLIWIGTTVAISALAVHSNRWELYGISGLAYLLYALTDIPDIFGIVCLTLAVASFARMVWCWLASRPKDRR